MGNIFTIFNREIKAYFNSAIAYIFIIVFLLISGGMFMTQFFLVSTADMRAFFLYLPVILCIFLSAITMRLWAEDRRGNTFELLLTFPMNTPELVLGKFLASLFFYIVSLLATLPIPIMIALLGRPDVGGITCQYLGAILMGGFFLSLGLFISGFCKDQIVSFILSMMACFGFFLLGTDFTAGSIDGWIPGLGYFLSSSLGMAQHFGSFGKGIIDSRDILYFVIGTVIFLVLNGFWLEARLRPKAKTIFSTACLISIGIFTIMNFILTDVPIGRFDLTEGKVYTISPITSEILQDLKSPVLVKLFISPPDKMPSGMKTLERDIRDKLDEFKVAAKGRFNYKVFHMETSNVTQAKEETMEKSIEKKGIVPFQVRSIEADEIGVKLVYASLSIAYKEKPEEIIPHIMPSDILDLEYKIISKIYKLTLSEQPTAALVAPYEEKAANKEVKEALSKLGQVEAEKFREDQYDSVMKLLEYESYKISRIKLTETEPIPDGTKTLIILEPRDLNDRQRFEINRFLVNGGSLFMAVQRYAFDYRPVGPEGFKVSPVDKNPQVEPLLEKWDLGVDKDFLMDKQMDVVSLEGGKLFGILTISSPVKLPIQIKVISDQMNKDISITSRLSTILYLWGNALDIKSDKLKESGLKARTLLSSSPESWEVPYHAGDLTSADVSMPPFEQLKSFPLAALVEGQFPDGFKGREIPAWPPQEGKEGTESYEKPKEKTDISPKPGKMILIGCSTIFQKFLFAQGGHANFFLNSIDALTLGEKLINVRSKQLVDRSIKSLSPATKAWWRIFVTFLMPIAVGVIGGLKLFMRRRSKWAYLRSI